MSAVDPVDPAAASLHDLRERGFGAHEGGDLGTAESCYRETLRRCAADLDVAHALGLLLLQTGRCAEASLLLAAVAEARNTAAAHADLGHALRAEGRFDAALVHYDRALTLQPTFAEARVNRGLLHAAQGRFEAALADIEAALPWSAGIYEAQIGRADALRALGNLDAAVEAYGRAAGLKPDDPLPHLMQAQLHLSAQRWAEGLACVDAAISRGAPTAEALTLRGLCLAGSGLRTAALESYERALLDRPEYVEALVNRGILLRIAGLPEEALASYSAAIAVRPDSVEAFCNRAAVLVDQRRFADAVQDCDRALAIDGSRPEAWLHRATALLGLDRFDEALAGYESAAALRPEWAEAHAGLAAVSQGRRDPAAALVSADRAVALAPSMASGHFNRGAALRDLGRIEEAVASFEAARVLRPDDPETNCNLGGLHLLLGRFGTGWPLYEWRAQLPDAPKLHRYTRPMWDGSGDVRGKTLFVYLDQGLGDTIQFSRFALLAERRGATVIMAVQGVLRRLLSSLSPTIRLLPESAAPPAFDLHCALASLPKAFGTTASSVPAEVPYLTAEADRVAHWRRVLGAEGFKIGVCWQGSTIKTGAGRSFPVRELEPIARLPGVRLISLQRGAGVDQLAGLPSGMRVETLGDEFDAGPDAFVDTAAVMQSLDLVITCDTSTAHVAGALGRPTWVVVKRVPDWRWMLERSDNPWYPSLRLFRQRVDGRWGDVVNEIACELSNFL